MSARGTTSVTKKSAAKKTPKASSAVKHKDICFVIMPFGGWFDGYYESIYKSAITNAGLSPMRTDDLYRPSSIVQDIWELTKKAKVILADLTGKNPNVFYELGLAHALAKPAILIAETIIDIPFDLRSVRIIEYNKNAPEWGRVLQESIENALIETLASPVQTIPAAFLDSNRSDIGTPQLTKHEKDLLEMKQELELIKRQMTGNYRVQTSGDTNYRRYLRSKHYNIERFESSVTVPILIKSMLDRGDSVEEIKETIIMEYGYPEEAIDTVIDNILGV